MHVQWGLDIGVMGLPKHKKQGKYHIDHAELVIL